VPASPGWRRWRRLQANGDARPPGARLGHYAEPRAHDPRGHRARAFGRAGADGQRGAAWLSPFPRRRGCTTSLTRRPWLQSPTRSARALKPSCRPRPPTCAQQRKRIVSQALHRLHGGAVWLRRVLRGTELRAETALERHWNACRSNWPRWKADHDAIPGVLRPRQPVSREPARAGFRDSAV
jgi:hypothetical protein